MSRLRQGNMHRINFAQLLLKQQKKKTNKHMNEQTHENQQAFIF